MKPIYIPLLLASILMALAGKATAQIGNPAYFYKAEKMYHAKKYFEAAQVFEKYLRSEQPSRSQGSPFAIEKRVKDMPTLNMHEAAIFNAAECYRNYNDYTHALKYYGMAAGFKDKAYVLAPFWYGVLLRAQGDYEKAYTVLTKFVESYAVMGPIMQRADREVEDLKFIHDQLHRADSTYQVEQRFLNGKTSAYALSVIHDDTVSFTSIITDSSKPAIVVANGHGPSIGHQPKSEPITKDYNAGLFQTKLGSSEAAIPMPLPDSTGIRQGLTCFSPDGRIMFFTRWAEQPSKQKAAIYRSIRNDSGWSAPVLVGGPVNVNGYNNTQPFLTRDGKYLLFSSDRPGGVGGYDLWFARLDSAFDAIVVTNMGTSINTPADDETPYYHEKSHVLTFSSNGRIGMGGFDIYSAQRGFDFDRWEQPVNAGVPVNSTKDDQYFVSTDEDNLWNTGFVSSDRSTDCCLAIFSVRQKNSLVVSGAVLDSATRQPLANADVTFRDYKHGDTVIGIRHTDDSGRYRIEMHNVSAFIVGATDSGYRPDSHRLTVELKAGANLFSAPDLLLVKPISDKDRIREQLKHLSDGTLAYFAFAKHDLSAAAYPNLDTLVSLLKRESDLRIEIAGYTDGKGKLDYNMKLAQSRVDVCVNYILKKGIDPGRIVGKAYGPCCPVAPETINGKDNPPGRALNRRVVYKMIE
jgi:outer membrane protein OmpA-like peptidoglycan-associated protein